MENLAHNFCFRTTGIIRWEDNNLRVHYSNDLINYYKTLIDRHYWINTTNPLHGAHTTICSAKLHNNVSKDLMKNWHNKKIEVSYSPHIHLGARNKDYRIFMLFIKSDVLNLICDQLKIKPPWNWHITVCNIGKSDNPHPYFPKQTTIK
jgi:hypothetical protein